VLGTGCSLRAERSEACVGVALVGAGTLILVARVVGSSLQQRSWRCDREIQTDGLEGSATEIYGSSWYGDRFTGSP